jgi:hypothetical protein
MQALRPLFSVTESLLSETRREPLLELIISAICGHLQCTHAACYQKNTDSQNFSLLALRGREFPKDFFDLITRVDASATPLLINANGPG